MDHAKVVPLAFVLALSGTALGSTDLRPGEPTALRAGSLGSARAGEGATGKSEAGTAVLAQTCYAGAWRRC